MKIAIELDGREDAMAFFEWLARLVVPQLSDMQKQLTSISSKLETIMATQAELTQQLNAVNDNLIKIGQETDVLLQTINDLNQVIANGPPVTPELQAAVDRVAAQAKVVDDKVPDVAPTP